MRQEEELGGDRVTCFSREKIICKATYANRSLLLDFHWLSTCYWIHHASLSRGCEVVRECSSRLFWKFLRWLESFHRVIQPETIFNSQLITIFK